MAVCSQNPTKIMAPLGEKAGALLILLQVAYQHTLMPRSSKWLIHLFHICVINR